MCLLVGGLLLQCKCSSCENNINTPKHPSVSDTIIEHSLHVDRVLSKPRKPLVLTDEQGKPIKNRILGVGNYDKAFPDMNDLQLATAEKLGVQPAADRDAARKNKKHFVYVADNPLYHVDKLSHSIPYLVPRAQRLLNEIARNFNDSLQRKGLPINRLIVTSVTRTEKDVEKLRRGNANASENSCHRYGTTFDICYECFRTLPDDPHSENQRNYDGRYKNVLAEVLRDLRTMQVCYVRYERKQSCFHITAR